MELLEILDKLHLPEKDFHRFDPKAIEDIIRTEKSRLNIWSLPRVLQIEIKEEIRLYEELLVYVKESKKII